MSFADQLVEMGFARADAQEAAKNCTSIETAMTWILSKQDAMEVDSAPSAAPAAPAAAGDATAAAVQQSITDQLIEFGVDPARAAMAAKNCPTVDSAMEWLVNNEATEAMDTDPAPAVAAPAAAAAPAASAAEQSGAAAISTATSSAATAATDAEKSIAERLVEFGYDQARADEAAKSCTTLEAAMDWLEKRQEYGGVDADPTVAASVAAAVKSFKCNDCGKLMRNEHMMMFHASKSGHENFEESTENIKPLTEEEKKEQAAKLKEKIAESMKAKAQAEEVEKIEREKKRVQEGKLMLERNEKRKEMEQLAAIAQRKREKEEEQTAKKRVLEQIQADKDARKAAAAGLPPPTPVPTPSTAPVVPVEKKDYKEATIQIRLPSGELLKHTFPSDNELSVVSDWLKTTKPDIGPFALLQPFPRKMMSPEDLKAPLASHGLVPSGSLVVTRPNGFW